MSLRRQLALIGLLLLILPFVGWRVAQQVEQFLRDAEQRALVATAESIARSFNEIDLSTSAEQHYVKPVDYRLSADGYNDEWQLWQRWQRRKESSGLSVSLLWAEDSRRLYGLVSVNDNSRARRGDLVDHLQLTVQNRRGLRDYRLTPGIAGSLRVERIGEDAADAPIPPIHGAWRFEENGYVVELDLPASLAEAVGLSVTDAGDPSIGLQSRSVALDTGLAKLIRSPAEWQEQLSNLAPPNNRLWLIDSLGWVRASSGQISAGAAGESRSWWRGLLYRWLVGPSLEAPQRRDPMESWQIEGSEVALALSGAPSTRWQRAAAEYTVIASTAVAIRDSQGQVVGALVVEQASDAMLLAANQTIARLGLWSLLAMALSGGVLFIFASLVSIRIRRLRNAVDGALEEALGDQDDASSFAASATKDEIGDLSRSFAGLLYELREYNQYLRTLATKLSHELNTPLAVARSSLDNLVYEELSEDAAAYAGRAQEGIERLQSILRAMSEAQRLEQSLNRQDPDWFDMSEVVRGCFDGYRAMDMRHDWKLAGAEDSARLYGAPELIAQLLDKLVDNARSFCPAGGTIEIRLLQRQSGLRLSVVNDGPILPSKLKQRLFDSMVSMREDGRGTHLGLGLHIVRLIARAHNGTVFARNRDDKRGVEIGAELNSMRKPTNPAQSESNVA